jgi:anti-sigma factor RsiW
MEPVTIEVVTGKWRGMMHTCRDIQALLPAYSVAALSATQAEMVRAHCAGCAACAAELAALERTGTLLAALPRPEPPAGLWDGVAAATIDRAPRRAPLPWWKPALTLAGLALVLVGGWVRHTATTPLPALQGTPAAYAVEYRLAHLQDPLADRAAVGLTLVEGTE